MALSCKDSSTNVGVHTLLKVKQDDRLARWPVSRLVWPLVVIGLLIGWVAVLAQTRSERRDAEIAAISRAQDRATLLEQHVVKILQVAALASLHFGNAYLTPNDGEGGAGTAPRRIVDPSVDIAGVSAVIVMDRNRRIVAASALGARWPSGLTNANLRLRNPRIPDVEISNPQTYGRSGQKYIFVIRRIRRNGSLAGYVALSFRPEQFINFPLRTKFDNTDLVSVINLGGVTLARREGDRFSSGEDVRGRLVMRKQIEQPNGSYLGPSSLDGIVRYFSHRRLQQFPIFVTAGVSHSAALRSARHRAQIYYSVMAVMSALGFLVAWIVQREVAFRQDKAAELAQSKQRLQEAQRIGKIGDWEYDLLADTVTWSDQLCEMYERSPQNDELTFADFTAYLAVDDFPQFEADLQFLLTNGGSHSYEFRVRLPSGKVSHRSIIAVASLSPEGEIIRLHGTDQDVTHLHLFRDLENLVAHLDRQGAMSMMAGTLAHELNQPLTAASNYITGALRQSIRIGESAVGSVASGLRHALDQIRDAAEIIRRVRKMIQTEVDVTKTASVQRAITDAIALLSASGLKEAEQIRIEIETDIPDAMISSIQLQQVLVNVLKNSLEAVSEDTGDVFITANVDINSFIRIEIGDNGPGFGNLTTDVFAVFSSQKETGTGIGLSISRTIIEYHGGKMQVEKSQPGETSIVILLLNAADHEAQAVQSGPA